LANGLESNRLQPGVREMGTHDGKVDEARRSVITGKSSCAGQERRVLASREPAAD